MEAFRIYYVKRREGDFSDLIPFTKGETDDDPIDELFSSMPSWGMWNMESRRAGLLSLEYALDGFDEYKKKKKGSDRLYESAMSKL